MKSMWVGFAFFVGILVLGFATLMIKDISLLAGGQRTLLFVNLDEALGLEEGDDVRVDGIPIGKVKYVGLYDDTYKTNWLRPAGATPELESWIEAQRVTREYKSQGVAVVAELRRPVELRKDAQVFVEGLALIGGAYLAIKTGSLTAEPRAMERVDDRVLIGTAKKSLLDEGADLIRENRDAVKKVVDNLAEVSENLKQITAEFKEGKGWLPDTITGLREDINKPLNEATEALKEVREVIRKVNEGEGTAAKIINSPEIHDELVKTIKEAREFIDSLKTGEGPLPAIINDPNLRKDLEEILQSVNSASKSLDNVIKSIENGWLPDFMQDKKIGEDLRSSVSGLQNTVGRLGNAETFLRVEGQSFADTKTSSARLAIHLWPTADKTIVVGGVFMTLDATGDILFEDQAGGEDQDFTKLEVQLAYRIPWLQPVIFRAGLFEGKPGAAFDVDFQRMGVIDWPISLHIEGRQAYSSVSKDDIDELVTTNGTLYRAYLRTPLYKKPSEGDGWLLHFLNALNVTFGVNRLFGSNEEIFIGIGVHYEERDIKAVAGLVGGP
jgi:ABC-type transporter Mla subunit MlaD